MISKPGDREIQAVAAFKTRSEDFRVGAGKEHSAPSAAFGPRRAFLMPREGHDLHIESSRLKIEPNAKVRRPRNFRCTHF